MNESQMEADAKKIIWVISNLLEYSTLSCDLMPYLSPLSKNVVWLFKKHGHWKFVLLHKNSKTNKQTKISVTIFHKLIGDTHGYQAMKALNLSVNIEIKSLGIGKNNEKVKIKTAIQWRLFWWLYEANHLSRRKRSIYTSNFSC